jgi:hypothetical protein
VRARRLVLIVVALLLVGATSSSAGTSTGPANLAPPSVTGTAAAGRQLTALSGTWAGSGAIAYTFRWARCDANGARCNPIRGATSPTYKLVARDVGRTIALTVEATDETGTVAAYASLVGPIAEAKPLLVSTGRPLVVGDPVQGKVLQVGTGTWSPTPARVTYSWLRCNGNGRICSLISGATGSTYTLGPSDVGRSLVALVHASFGRTTQAALSTATRTAVAASLRGPTPLTGPTVAGTPMQGEQLTASTGTWSGVGDLRYAYQWYRCNASGARCSTIRGATGATYRLAARDVGRTLGLTVRATDATGTHPVRASLFGPIAQAPAPLVATGQPAIAGDPRPGQTLTVSAGSWSPAARSHAYAWQRCNAHGRFCRAIAGATAAYYVVAAGDSGHALVALVTATAGANSQATLSAAVRVH